MNTIVIDIGGTNVKLWRTGVTEKHKVPSGKELGPRELVNEVRQWLDGVPFDRVSIGYPGEVVHGRPVKEPYNLGDGWVEFDFETAFGCPIRMMNDACMQALGSYDGGRMLYLGLGTGVGTTFISDGKIVPLALGHLQFSKSDTFTSALSREALKKRGVKRWSAAVVEAAQALRSAFLADYVVLGGGNAKKLPTIPEGCRRGDNFNAYLGGVRLWEDSPQTDATLSAEPPLLRVNGGPRDPAPGPGPGVISIPQSFPEIVRLP